MIKVNWKSKIESFDHRRDIVIPGNPEETVLFCARQFIEIGQEALKENGIFTVAFSGGSTPNAIFTEISKPEYIQALDWSKVYCFWSDERSVSSNHPDSNYFNAMQAGLEKLPLRTENIFRMEGERDITDNAEVYEQIIRKRVPSLQFDLIMLGMGEDGHTASLFPCTHGLHAKDRLVIANYIPQKDTWRMTLTYECIHMAKAICIYVMGANKAQMVARVFLDPYEPDNLPIQRIGTSTHKALWILDTGASEELIRRIK